MFLFLLLCLGFFSGLVCSSIFFFLLNRGEFMHTCYLVFKKEREVPPEHL